MRTLILIALSLSVTAAEPMNDREAKALADAAAAQQDMLLVTRRYEKAMSEAWEARAESALAIVLRGDIAPVNVPAGDAAKGREVMRLNSILLQCQDLRERYAKNPWDGAANVAYDIFRDDNWNLYRKWKKGDVQTLPAAQPETKKPKPKLTAKLADGTIVEQ